MGVQRERSVPLCERGAYNKSNYMWESFYERAGKRKQKADNRQQAAAAATARMASFLRDTREGLASAEICQIKNGMPCGGGVEGECEQQRVEVKQRKRPNAANK